MIRIYIASPYSIGDKEENVRRSLDCANTLMDMGYAPFAPLLSHYQNLLFPRPEADWLAFDLEWVLACDCVLRLSGESNGADGEVRHAKMNKIPVFKSIDELNNYYQK